MGRMWSRCIERKLGPAPDRLHMSNRLDLIDISASEKALGSLPTSSQLNFPVGTTAISNVGGD